MAGNSLSVLGRPYFVSAASSSPLTSGTLFTFKGTIAIVSLTGRVTTGIEVAGTNTKLSVVSDTLDAYDICANKDISGFAVGSVLSITGTAADPMVGTTAVGAIAPGQASVVFATCVASGVITVTYGAASTGAITWELCYEPLSAGALVV
jgi:hypothetical protein